MIGSSGVVWYWKWFAHVRAAGPAAVGPAIAPCGSSCQGQEAWVPQSIARCPGVSALIQAAVRPGRHWATIYALPRKPAAGSRLPDLPDLVHNKPEFNQVLWIFHHHSR